MNNTEITGRIRTQAVRTLQYAIEEEMTSLARVADLYAYVADAVRLAEAAVKATPAVDSVTERRRQAIDLLNGGWSPPGDVRAEAVALIQTAIETHARSLVDVPCTLPFALTFARAAYLALTGKTSPVSDMSLININRAKAIELLQSGWEP